MDKTKTLTSSEFLVSGILANNEYFRIEQKIIKNSIISQSFFVRDMKTI